MTAPGQALPPGRAAAAPRAVKVLVALMIAQVVVGLVSIPLAFSRAEDQLRTSLAASGSTADVNTIKTIAVVVGVVFGALYVGLALVILRGKKWAWITALVLVSLGLLGSFASLGNAANRTALTPVSAVLLVAIFVLLLMKPVRDHVDSQRGAPGSYGGGPYGGGPYGGGPYGGGPGGYGAPSTQPGIPPGAAPPGSPQQGPGWGQPQQPPPGYPQAQPPPYPPPPS